MTARIGCVVFDFDGVLIDSNAVKRRSYYDIFANRAEAALIVEACLSKHANGDRHDVIRCILDALPEHSGDRDALPIYVQAYGQRCDDLIAACTETRGATRVLDRLARHYSLFVNSATPEESLQRYISDRGWSPRFRAVLGRPRSKLQNLAVIAQLQSAPPSSMLFVGDHQSDAAAAAAAGCAFVGVRSDDHDFRMPCRMLESLEELPGYLADLEQDWC